MKTLEEKMRYYKLIETHKELVKKEDTKKEESC